MTQNIKNFATNQLVSLGTQGLQKFVGNIPGLTSVSGNRTSKSPQARLNNFSTRGNGEPKALQFPLDVTSNEGLGNHGHYIMFYINAQEDAKLTTEEVDKSARGSIADDPDQQYSTPDFITEFDGVKNRYIKNAYNKGYNVTNQYYKNKIETEGIGGTGDPTIENINQTVYTPVKKNKRFTGSTIKLTRAPTRRLKTGIALFMPASVQTTYTANYTDTEIGGGTEDALNAFNAAVGSKFDRSVEAFFAMEEAFIEGAEKLLLSTASTIVPGLGGVREAAFAKQGAIISDRMELAFKGINKRQFQYTFKMIPRSQEEAEEIRKIIFVFKNNMLPEFVGGNRAGRRLRVPNTFDIQYMYNGRKNDFLHHISTCVLESMNVSYGGDRYKTFQGQEDGAPPVETSITLNFKEMELITRERINEGF